MTDDPRKHQEDAHLISLTEDYEVRYWTERFGCTEDRLRDAIKRVGHSADRVKIDLGITD